ncbi:hypothetical protein HDE_04182 [Halotydeus destructor]|nr:hypothetical protein HDE_04182 [Halotydeus destructor]
MRIPLAVIEESSPSSSLVPGSRVGSNKSLATGKENEDNYSFSTQSLIDCSNYQEHFKKPDHEEDKTDKVNVKWQAFVHEDNYDQLIAQTDHPVLLNQCEITSNHAFHTSFSNYNSSSSDLETSQYPQTSYSDDHGMQSDEDYTSGSLFDDAFIGISEDFEQPEIIYIEDDTLTDCYEVSVQGHLKLFNRSGSNHEVGENNDVAFSESELMKMLNNLNLEENLYREPEEEGYLSGSDDEPDILNTAVSGSDLNASFLSQSDNDSENANEHRSDHHTVLLDFTEPNMSIPEASFFNKTIEFLPLNMARPKCFKCPKHFDFNDYSTIHGKTIANLIDNETGHFSICK